MSWLCERCGAEFEDINQYKKHRIDHQQGRITDQTKSEPTEAPVVPSQPPIEVKKPDADRKPIILTYLYTGNCDGCGKEVSTLELDINDKHFAVAFCTACKKQKTSKEVKKL